MVQLSAEGEKNAKAAYFEDSVIKGFESMNISKNKEGLIHVSSSDVQRAIDSAQIINNKIKETKHRQGKTNKQEEKLAVPFQPAEDAKEKRFADDLDVIVKMQKELKPQIKKEIDNEFPNADEREKEAELRNRIDMIILTRMFEDQENKTFQTNWEELADMFAKRYFGFARHKDVLKKLKSGGKQPKEEPYIQIDVTHSLPVMAFLKKYLIFDNGEEAINMKPEDFFSKTGGIIRESGNFEMKYIEDENNKIKILVTGEFEKGKKFKGTINLIDL